MDLISFVQELVSTTDVNKFICSHEIQHCQPGRNITCNNTDAEIILVSEGIAILHIDGENLKIPKNNCFIISGQAFTLASNDAGICTFLRLRLDFKAAALSDEKWNIFTLISPAEFNMLQSPSLNEKKFLRIADCMEIQFIIKKIFDELEFKAHYQNILLKLFLCELLLTLARMIEKRNAETVNTTNTYISNTIDYICSHLSHELSTQSIAGEVHLSPDYLNHIFKACTGYSLMEYVNIKRVERCKMLLKQTSLSISRIASEVGVSNSQYLSTLFKKFTSLSPKCYRKDTAAVAYANTVFPILINCGGSQLDGLLSDKPYKKGEWGYIGNTLIYSTEDFIESHYGYPAGLKTLRYGGIFSYRFDVSNGIYDITLLWAENYFTTENSRTFQIKINGKVVEGYFDIFCRAKGHHTGVRKVFEDICVSDGILEIEFSSIHNFAQINVIEITQKGH